MIDEEKLLEGLAELKRLNENLSDLHKDAEDFKPLKAEIRNLIARLEAFKGVPKSITAVAKQLWIFNQILLKTKSVAGWSGVIKHLLDSLTSIGQ